MTTAPTHGKSTYISVATKDISAYTTDSQFKHAADKHEVTAYGATGHEYADGLGLKAHHFTCSGWFDTTASTGTAAVLDGQEGQLLAIVRRIQGTGTGKPEQTFNAVLDDYTETSPVADIVKWSANFTVSGDVSNSTQA